MQNGSFPNNVCSEVRKVVLFSKIITWYKGTPQKIQTCQNWAHWHLVPICPKVSHTAMLPRFNAKFEVIFAVNHRGGTLTIGLSSYFGQKKHHFFTLKMWQQPKIGKICEFLLFFTEIDISSRQHTILGWSDHLSPRYVSKLILTKCF